MKTYLEIKVPINYDDHWFEELRSRFSGIPVRWQKGFYHITMVFVDEAPKGVDMRPLLKRHFANEVAPVLTFDRLDIFSTRSGMHVIHLSASQIPERFLALTESIREDMKTAGCLIQSDFMLHVTLGRLRDFNNQSLALKNLVKSFPLLPFTLTLTDIDYRVFRGNTIYETCLPV